MQHIQSKEIVDMHQTCAVTISPHNQTSLEIVMLHLFRLNDGLKYSFTCDYYNCMTNPLIAALLGLPFRLSISYPE